MPTTRINKAIADAGLCSRRNAEQLVLEGRVALNGVRVTSLATTVDTATDRIEVDGKRLTFPDARICLLMHKPVQTVCTARDPQGRTTVLDILPPQYAGVRLYPVGRLDYFSEGLLLLTDDGPLAQRLTHPKHHITKTYQVLVRGAVSEDALRTMRSGMKLAEGETLAPVDVTAQETPQGRTMLTMVLRQGINRQIRRMCRDLGLTILRLTRVALGPLTLGSLPAGAVRALTHEEMAALTKSAATK